MSSRTRSIAVSAALAAVVVTLPVLALVLRTGRAAPPAVTTRGGGGRIATPRLPPPGGVVLGRESGRLGVIVSARPRGGRLALTATVLGPSGSGASGLRVAFRGGGRRAAARPCGSGCYSAALPGRPRHVVALVGDAAVPFTFPARAPSAGPLVRRVARALRGARSLVIHERLASSPTRRVLTRFEIAAPNRLTYRIVGGSDAVVIGSRRWDRASPREPWVQSGQTPLDLPAVPWGRRARDARLVRDTPRLWIVTLLDPDIPSCFELRIDKRTFRPSEVRMIAASHFMRDRYSRYDEPLRIRPPKGD